MKTKGLIFAVALFAIDGFLYGQDLLLTFDGKDTTVDSVRVENLTSGERVIAGGNQLLRLVRIVSDIEKPDNDAAGGISFSPNPMNEYSIMEFTIPASAETAVSVIDLAGKEILKLNRYLAIGRHSFRLSGLRSGMHFVMIRSGGFALTGTLLSVSAQGNADAEYLNSVSFNHSGKQEEALNDRQPEKRGSFSEVSMQFTDGDSLKFTASSGNYRKVLFDAPDMSKTMTFEFFECTDGDKNEYPSVKIGNFIWMTENLRTTTFNDGTPIRYEKDDLAWASLDDKCIPAFSWYNNDEGYRNVYGGLYNSAVVSRENGKNVCPDGWHVAAGEWDDLFSYLDSAAAPDGEVSKTAGNLIKESGNMHWACPDNKGTNETGFTALPGGFRNPGFSNLGERAYFWDGSDGKFIIYCTSGVVGHLAENYDYGLSVRCVKDKEMDITFSASGASSAVSDVKVENLSTGALITLKGNQILHLGNGAGPAGTVFMAYLPGQNLKFTGTSGKYSTVVVEKPIENKTINFNFIQCTDGDGNNYPVVKIGDQVWMAENLKATKYRDGSPIPYIDYPLISGLVCDGDPGYSWYNDDVKNKNIYGGLYTLKTLRTKKLCPVGWHVMAHAEMDSLISYLGGGASYQAGYGGRSDDGGKLKETGTTHWKSPNGNATNETGFTALPGGIREEDGTFRWIGEYATFMSFNVCDGSSCDGCMYTFNYANGEIHGDEYRGTTSTSVRCIYGGGPQILSTWIDSASVDLTSVTAEGEIDEFEIVTERGLCWSTYSWSTTNSNNTPSINDSHIATGSGTGRFSAKITGLEPGTLYWVRAYARNDTGITYADPVSFTTSVKDIDGNVYKTELLDQGIQGQQIWMKSNLRTVKLNDNSIIPELRSATDWSNSQEPAYCSYDNAGTENGLLYNWFTVATSKLCPLGWKIADTIQFRINQCFYGCNPDKRTLIPAGMRDASGEFKEKGETGYFWSGTEDKNYQFAWTWSFKTGSSLLSLSALNKKSGLSVRCFKDLLPEVITTAVTDLAPTSATVSGLIVSEGNGSVIEKGFLWRMYNNYVAGEALCTSCNETFSGKITRLQPAKSHFVQAYAKNHYGTSYGKEIQFTTPDYTKVADSDGNFYSVIQIGEQFWFMENLRSTKLNDGTSIRLITDNNTEWYNSATPAYCFYPGSVPELYGGVYNWQSVNSGKLCPSGWHVPTDGDWTVLTDYLIANRFNYDGTLEGNKIAKALISINDYIMTMFGYWKYSDITGSPGNYGYTEKINASGFSARTAPTRGVQFSPIDEAAIFWSSTPRHSTGDYYVISYNGVGAMLTGPDSGDKQGGFAVRCLKDQ